MTNRYDFASILGIGPGSPLHAIARADRIAVYLSQQAMRHEEAHDREKFYRSCSRNWLNAMLDVELGS